MSSKDDWPRAKKWKELYTRSVKLKRAQQLGIDYPRVPAGKLVQRDEQDGLRNVLFICSRNQWRSPTAEKIWSEHPRLATRSAGTSPNARRKVSVEDIRWADVIMVMEEKHKSRLIAEFTRLVEHKPIHVLEIPDEFQFMDPELIVRLKAAVERLLGIK